MCMSIMQISNEHMSKNLLNSLMKLGNLRAEEWGNLHLTQCICTVFVGKKYLPIMRNNNYFSLLIVSVTCRVLKNFKSK